MEMTHVQRKAPLRHLWLNDDFRRCSKIMLVHLLQLVDWQHRESRGGDWDDCAAIALRPAPVRHGEARLFIEQLALEALHQTPAGRRPVAK